MYFNITNKINLLLLSTILLCCNVSYCSNNNHNEQNEQLNCSSNTNPNMGVPLCAILQPNSPCYSPSYYVPGNDLSGDSSDTFSNVRSLTSYGILKQISDNHLSNDISQQTSGGSSHHFPSNISNNIDSNNSNYNNDNSLQNL